MTYSARALLAMHEDLSPLLKILPPRTFRALQQAIHLYSKRQGKSADWVHRWIGFVVVGDALVRHHAEGHPVFELKGGAALELRLHEQRSTGAIDPSLASRATKDLDVVFSGDQSDIEERVTEALREARHPFTARAEVDHRDGRVVRFRVRIGYTTPQHERAREYHLCSVKLEVSPYEGRVIPPDAVKSFSLTPLGIEGPDSLPCMSLARQVAQKFHAMTAPAAPGVAKDRFRDLVDLVVLSAMAPASGEIRACCVETFAIRATHTWPPTVAVPEQWHEPAERLAAEMRLEASSVEALEAHVNRYLRDIDAAREIT